MWFGTLILRLTQLLPMRWQMKIGAGLGRLVYRFLKKRVHIARRNLELCFPEKSEQEREALVLRNFEETGKAVFDSINAWWWSDAKVQKHSEILGFENLQTCLDNGQGVILFAVHALPLEMGARVYGQRGTGVGVYRPHNNPLMEYFQVNGRMKSATSLVPKREVRQMVKALRRPDVIWYTADQDFGRSTAVFIPLFAHQEAATITGATALAKMGRAKVLPFFIERNADDSGYLLDIGEPLEDFPGESEVDDAIRGNKIVEQLISRNPAQYMWLHRRFKTRPNEDDPSLY
ncbi:lipid A biosynthesis lauroyltransferase [Paraferrimonas sedimenticola]|uniref:Lipid A biosynthesis acyltransferase n=2 Tax=Paraferrimonas sedimenticola TaxID=375674 RepID=A0AA37W0N7_9GAMM|nr:lipid A biosynthesis lauroyltransferase [Paraferrimonas sedimenticola]